LFSRSSRRRMNSRRGVKTRFTGRGRESDIIRERGMRRRKRGKNRRRDEIKIVIDEEEITVFGRSFPIAKSNQNDRLDRNEIGGFIARPEFATNMTSEVYSSRIMRKRNKTHTIPK
jgi:hypothetical protein